MRCMWDGKGALWTRAGKSICTPPSVLAQLPAGTMLDGELWLGRGRFSDLMSVVRRIQSDAAKLEATWQGVTYFVFDAPDAPGGIFDRLSAARTALASASSGTGTAGGSGGAVVRVLEHETLTCSTSELKAKLDQMVSAGGEGLVARHPTAPHRGGRTTDLLKLKTFHDDEALVTGHEPGKGKHTGKLGALMCRLRSGVTFKVGTGFTDAEREAPPPVGSVITFRYFELTKDLVPRFPSYDRVRPDAKPSDFS